MILVRIGLNLHGMSILTFTLIVVSHQQRKHSNVQDLTARYRVNLETTLSRIIVSALSALTTLSVLVGWHRADVVFSAVRSLCSVTALQYYKLINDQIIRCC